MPLPGGATDKIGNRYEGLWTIDRMIDIIDEKATSIRLEPPGEEGEGVEFWIQKGDIREYHQVKRQKSQGAWTISSLETKEIRVLSNFKSKLNQPSSHCVFVSTISCYELEELSCKAREANFWREFVQNFINAEQWQQKFSKLCSKWSNYQYKEIEEAIDSFKEEKLSNNQQKIIQIAIETYEKLKRVYVETISEGQLSQKIEVRLRSLVEKKGNGFPSHEDWQTAVDILVAFALENIHQELTASDIWRHLDERGYQRCDYSKNPHILAQIENANKLYLLPLKKQIVIGGECIPREEVQQVLNSLLNTKNKQGVLLVGEAGIGKSGVMFQIAKELEKKKINFLAFRIDNLTPQVHPDDVGEQLKLPMSPATVLGNITRSQKRNWVLIIDQLDAVSQASGRNPEFFDCIASIIEQALNFSNVRVLVACRQFDLDNDSRIKTLTGEKGILKSVKINKLSNSKVRETVKNLGIDDTKLNEKQINLLQLPLHLGLLAEISQDATIETLNFETANDLFDKFWEYKQRQLRERISDSVNWTNVIDKLCNYMNSQQSLSAPKYIVDKYFTDAEIMISENILIQEDKSLRFFHESFFDYAFARRFTERGQKLLSFLREDEQHLFKRAQVRQILLHEREINPQQYLDNLDELLKSDDIRFHVKQLVIALLSNLQNPREEEWDIIQPRIRETDSPLCNLTWRLLYKPSWFMLAQSLGIIEKWLRDNNNKIINNTVSLLCVIARELPNEIPNLIEPFIEDLSEKWFNRLLFIGERISLDLHSDRKLLDLFLTLLDKGKLDTLRDTFASNGDFWLLIFSLSQENSEWTCEVIGHYLNRRLELYLIQILSSHLNYLYCLNINNYFLKQYTKLEIRLNPFEGYRNEKATIPDTQNTSIFRESANKSSKSYVINVLPFMLSVIELTSIKDGEKPWIDSVWYYRSYGQGYGIDNDILKGMETALSNLAKNCPETFSDIVQQYLYSSDFETIQFLLIRAYTANDSKFADEAAEYLCENSYRLKTGYSGVSYNSTSARFWASRELLKVIFPHCSKNNLHNLESLILNYYPFSKDLLIYSKSSMKMRDYPQFVLLDSLNDILIQQSFNIILIKYNILTNNSIFSRLILLTTPFFIPSKILTQRLLELQRKFESLGIINQSSNIKPQPIAVGWVGPPITQEATAKMTDEQWLEAINKYNYQDGGTRFQQTGELQGGAFQLSDNLEKEVVKEPHRFAELIGKFPDNANSYYFDAVLRGISQTEIEIDYQTILRVCQRCHQLPQKPCGRYISWLIKDLAHLSWDEQALEIITYYALNDPNPEPELQQTQASNLDIYSKGINTVRGSAVKTIAQLIFKNKERTAYFQAALEQIVQDSSLAVRSCAAVALTAVLNYDRDLAVDLFKKLAEAEDGLLGTQPVGHFLYYALNTHYTALEPIIQRMINSEIPAVQEIGAKQVFVQSVVNSDAQSLAEKCLSGTISHRKAAALVYGSNFHLADYQEFCEEALIKLFNDPDEQVRRQAAKCFFNLDQQNLANHSNLIDNFLQSSAFLKNNDSLIRLFTRTNDKISLNKRDFEMAFKICQSFIEVVGSQIADIQSSSSVYDKVVSQILLQIYSQNRDSKLQTECLNLIDRLYQFGANGLYQAMTEYER